MKYRFRIINEDMSNEYDSEGNQLTKEQAEFFKNSKIRDSQGRLLVCYHGSPSKNIDTFMTFQGAFFSPSAEYASAYMLDKFAKKKGKLYKVYLNITNPFDNSTKEMNDLTNEFVEWLKQKEYTTYDDKFFKESPPHFVIVDDLYCFMHKLFRTGKSKYDGIVVNEEGSSPPISFVSLHPNQIKSITNKNPTNSDNINESLMMKDGMYVFDTALSLINFLKNQKKDIRILYDANIDKYFACDGNEYIHWDILEQAYKEGYYHKFIDREWELDGYQYDGVNGGWDENDEEIDPYLYYIIFSPDNSFELGDDDYDEQYDTSIGKFLTRESDIKEIDLYRYIKKYEVI